MSLYDIRCRKFLRINFAGYKRKGEAMATGTKIIRGLFGLWEKFVQNVLGDRVEVKSESSLGERKSVGR